MASPTPNDLTRQQLDELDTLLQRMLSLPLSKPEPPAPAVPPPPLPDLPLPAPRSASVPMPRLAPEPPAARDPEPQFAPSFLPFTPPPRPAPAALPPSVELSYPDPSPAIDFVPAGTLRGVDAPALPYDFRRADPAPLPPPPPPFDMPDVNPFATPAAAVPPETALPKVAHLPVPVFLWPLFTLNWLLEFVLGWFGPVGAFLTRPATKWVLGWAGVLLCVGAGVLAARGMGWVAWPR